MNGNTLLWVISVFQAFILGIFVYATKKMKSMKLRLSENTLYKELHYIKALLVTMTIVLVFFGWNIKSNIVSDLKKDLENKASVIRDSIFNQTQRKLTNDINELKEDLKGKIEQDFSTALNGFIVEVSLDTCKTEISYKFKDLKDIKGNLINNDKDFENIPIVSLNYVGQPYTITEVTIEGFTVKRLALFEGYTISEMGPQSFNENKLIIWIINRD